MEFLLLNLFDNQRKLLLFAPIITETEITAKAFKIMADIPAGTILYATTTIDETIGWFEFKPNPEIKVRIETEMLFPEEQTPGILAGIHWKPITLRRLL
jgi:hypothetical protein